MPAYSLPLHEEHLSREGASLATHGEEHAWDVVPSTTRSLGRRDVVLRLDTINWYIHVDTFFRPRNTLIPHACPSRQCGRRGATETRCCKRRRPVQNFLRHGSDEGPGRNAARADRFGCGCIGCEVQTIPRHVQAPRHDLERIVSSLRRADEVPTRQTYLGRSCCVCSQSCCICVWIGRPKLITSLGYRDQYTGGAVDGIGRFRENCCLPPRYNARPTL